MHINRQLILSMYVCITLSVYLPHNPLYEVLPILFAGVSFYLSEIIELLAELAYIYLK